MGGRHCVLEEGVRRFRRSSIPDLVAYFAGDRGILSKASGVDWRRTRCLDSHLSVMLVISVAMTCDSVELNRVVL